MRKTLTKKQKIYLAAAAFLAVVFACGIIFVLKYFTPDNTNAGLYAKEISLEEVPESIQAEMTATLEEPGAYFYKESEDSTVVYALLTAGKVVGTDMAVDPTPEDGGMYFSVVLQDNSSFEKGLLYKIYVTNASAVAGDDQRLKNPYEQVGDEGMNLGIIEKMDSGIGYYILPLMDMDEVNRVYVPADNTLANLENGLYLYTYKLTKDGVQLLSAEKRESYEISCVITDFSEEPTGAAVTLILDDQIKLTAGASDAAVLKTLKDNDFTKYSLNCSVTLTFDQVPIISSIDVMSFNLLESAA